MIGRAARKLTFLALLGMMSVPGILIPSGQASQDDKYAHKREARRLTKSAVEFVEKGIHDSALATLDTVLAADSSSADAWYYRGLVQARTADTAAAIESLSQGAAHAPLSARIKLLLARLNLATGEPAAAETLLDQILAIKPNESEALFLKGLAQLAQSDTVAAVASFEHALKGVYPLAGAL